MPLQDLAHQAARPVRPHQQIVRKGDQVVWGGGRALLRQSLGRRLQHPAALQLRAAALVAAGRAAAAAAGAHAAAGHGRALRRRPHGAEKDGAVRGVYELQLLFEMELQNAKGGRKGGGTARER